MLIDMEYLLESDTKLLLFLNSFHNPFFDELMWIITGKFTWFPLYLLILFFFFYKKNWKHGVLAGLSAIVLVILADKISVVCFKEVFCRLRPSREPALEGLVHLVHGKRGGLYGFVSSHAANTFAFATFLTLYYRKIVISISIFAWAAIVSYSRIYMAVHYPGDILGGMILGIVCGFGMFRLFTYLHSKLLHETFDKKNTDTI